MSDGARADVDLTDLALFARGAPHELFARLRREAPVHWHPEREGPGFWSLTRHQDVRAVSLDTRSLSSARLGNMIFDQFVKPGDRSRMMIELDPPAHTRQRALVNKGFSPRMIRRLEGFARKVTSELLDRALARGRCDFVSDIAGLLPTQIIAEMMGVPPQDRPRVYELANRVMAFADPEFGGGSGGVNIDAMAQMQRFAEALGQARRREPRDDIASALLEAEIDGDRLSDEEFQLFFLLLITAGIETTRSILQLAERNDVDMPIARAVYGVLFEGCRPRDAVDELMTRRLRAE